MNNIAFVSIYIAAMVGANLSVATFGPIISPLNAFLLIGLDFYLRDRMHEQWVGNGLMLKMAGMIAAAGAISYALNPATGTIALASFVAFCAAQAVDALVYQALLKKKKVVKQNASNAAGAAVDSLLFPTIAFGALMPGIVLLQFVAKVAGGLVWSYMLEKRFFRSA